MLKDNKHIVKITTGLLIVAATLFCVLFGQGTHLHDLDIHIGSHFDVHAHLHAHDSHDEPFQNDHNQDDSDHRHKVKTASDIIGTLTSQVQVKNDKITDVVFSPVTCTKLADPKLSETPFLFALPPPRPVFNQYHLSSFSHRGPPIA